MNVVARRGARRVRMSWVTSGSGPGGAAGEGDDMVGRWGLSTARYTTGRAQCWFRDGVYE